MIYLYELAFEEASRILLFWPDGTCFTHNDTPFTQDVKIKHSLIPEKNKVWILGLGLNTITKTQIRLGFIPRPIPMELRFDGFLGYGKMCFGYGY